MTEKLADLGKTIADALKGAVERLDGDATAN